jgi:hypothetical protein
MEMLKLWAYYNEEIGFPKENFCQYENLLISCNCSCDEVIKDFFDSCKDCFKK